MAHGTNTHRFGGRWYVTVCLAALGLLVAAPAALAKDYSDVPDSHWAHAQITWVTNQGPSGHHLMDDFAGGRFRPERAITRAQMARALVIASGHWGEHVDDPVELADVSRDHPDYWAIQYALKHDWMAAYKDEFHPSANVRSWQADRAVVRMLRSMYASDDWSMLRKLSGGQWEPNQGYKPVVPRYFSSEVAARWLGLRFNHPYGKEEDEFSPNEAIDRDEVAYIFYQALHVSAWRIDGLTAFNTVTFPRLTKRQKAILEFACKYEGYPYVYAGEYPKCNSPYGYQEHGGFDCSGFTWWVMKMHFGYRVDERVAADMARVARPRITRANLTCGDLIFFGPNGPKSTPASIYHAALYLGKGWFIHSTGSTDGVSLGSINWDGWSWKSDFAWGRRVLKAGQFIARESAAGEADLVPTGPAPPLGPAPEVTPTAGPVTP